MKRAAYLCSLLVAAASLPTAASAGELFGGLYVHDVKLPTDESGIEPGFDVMVGYRGGTLWKPFAIALQPYAFGAINSAGQTSYAAAGLATKFSLGRSIFIRPGLGLAIHDGSAGKFFNPDRIAFGSRVLFEPELGIGTRINPRLSIEASWVHMSHAQLHGPENPGIDNLGARLTLGL